MGEYTPNMILARKYLFFKQVFERIKAVANADMVGKVNACYVFEVEGGEGKYYIDLKEGEGQVGEGDPNKLYLVLLTLDMFLVC